MLKRDLVSNASLVAPAEAEDAFLKKLEYRAPFDKAANWLIRLVIHKIRDVEAIMPWYLGETSEIPQPSISTLFDQSDCRLCTRLGYLCHIILKYRQGEIPEETFTDLCKSVRILLNRLRTCKGNLETIRLIERRVTEFKELVECKKGHILTDSYERQVETFKDSFIALFGRVSDDFLKVEAGLRGESEDVATKKDLNRIVHKVDSIKESVDGTVSRAAEKATVQLVDAIEKGADKVAKAVRKKKGRKPKIGVDVQEAVWNIHIRESKNSVVKNMGGGRALREHEFSHAKSELKTYGILTYEDYQKVLGIRSKRHSRVAVRSVRSAKG